MNDERPRFRVNRQSMVGNALVAEGTEVIYTPPGPDSTVDDNLSPLNDAAQKVVDRKNPDGSASRHPDRTGGPGFETIAAEAVAADEEEDTNGIIPKKGPNKTPAGDTRKPVKRGPKDAVKTADKGDTPGDDKPAVPAPKKDDEDDMA